MKTVARVISRGTLWKQVMAAAAGAGGLVSCALAEGRLDRGSPPVAVTAYLFAAPDDFAFVKGQTEPGVAGTYGAEAGEKLAASLSKRRGFALLQDKPLVSTAKAGARRELKVTREFIYPTEYHPAVPGKTVDGELQSVTPATPDAFETRDLGVVLGYRAKRVADGKIEVELDLERGSFLGFVNYGTPITAKRKGAFGREVEVTLSENRIEMPVFDVRRMKSTVQVNDGDFIAVGGMRPAGAPRDRRFSPWKGGSPESAASNFVALIQVKSAVAE